MEIRPFLPDPSGLCCDRSRVAEGTVTLELHATAFTARCPTCGWPSRRVHSRYTRVLEDLPWMGTPVRMRLETRRFFCDSPTCARKTFAEPLPRVAAAHARKTCRLAQALCKIGFALGGQAGSRLAAQLHMATSGDTVLRLVRRAPPGPTPTVAIAGVDDWAWCKGRRYGTILCDLERHQPVDLLPERSAEALSTWLKAHPGVRVITRDRGSYYAQGASSGAPEAVQVADRFHLLCNLREALVRALDRRYPDLRKAAKAAAASQAPPPQAVAEVLPTPALPSPPGSRARQAKEASRSRRLARYEQVVRLRQRGVSMRDIARQMRMHRGTVRRFLRAGQFPERAVRKYVRQTDRFMGYLRQRWEEGCHNATQLTGELAERGFRGSYAVVRRCVSAWREPDHPHTPGPKPVVKPASPVPPPSPNQTAWLLVRNPEDYSVEENAFLAALWQECPELQHGAELARQFIRMVQDRQADALDSWIDRTREAGVPHELTVFAEGLLPDYEAVKAALRLEWSNGQVEGQVNRLKMIKRQMYGRAGFALLRQRVLNAG